MAETGKTDILNNDVFVILIIFPRVKLNPDVRRKAYKFIETHGFHEFSVGLGFANNQSTINSNFFSAIDIYSDFAVRKDTPNDSDVAGSMKEYVF